MADKKTSSVSVDPLPDVIKIADEIRSSANNMTDAERDEAFSRGMQLIYGGTAGCIAATTGRA